MFNYKKIIILASLFMSQHVFAGHTGHVGYCNYTSHPVIYKNNISNVDWSDVGSYTGSGVIQPDSCAPGYGKWWSAYDNHGLLSSNDHMLGTFGGYTMWFANENGFGYSLPRIPGADDNPSLILTDNGEGTVFYLTDSNLFDSAFTSIAPTRFLGEAMYTTMGYSSKADLQKLISSKTIQQLEPGWTIWGQQVDHTQIDAGVDNLVAASVFKITFTGSLQAGQKITYSIYDQADPQNIVWLAKDVDITSRLPMVTLKIPYVAGVSSWNLPLSGDSNFPNYTNFNLKHDYIIIISGMRYKQTIFSTQFQLSSSIVNPQDYHNAWFGADQYSSRQPLNINYTVSGNSLIKIDSLEKPTCTPVALTSDDFVRYWEVNNVEKITLPLTSNEFISTKTSSFVQLVNYTQQIGTGYGWHRHAGGDDGSICNQVARTN